MSMRLRSPRSVAAPRLGQQLRAIEWIANTIVDAHVDALNSLARSRCRKKKQRSKSDPGGGEARAQDAKSRAEESARIVDSTSVDHRVFRQPGGRAQACLQPVRRGERTVLHHPYAAGEKPGRQRSEARRPAGDGAACRGRRQSSPRRRARTPEQAITFIVGTEHLTVTAKIEILKFNFPEKEAR